MSGTAEIDEATPEHLWATGGLRP